MSIDPDYFFEYESTVSYLLPAYDALYPTSPSQGQKEPLMQVNYSIECNHRTSTYRGQPPPWYDKLCHVQNR